jgi:hypothetical protein
VRIASAWSSAGLVVVRLGEALADPSSKPVVWWGSSAGGHVMGLLFAFALMGLPLLFALYDLSQTKA